MYYFLTLRVRGGWFLVIRALLTVVYEGIAESVDDRTIRGFKST